MQYVNVSLWTVQAHAFNLFSSQIRKNNWAQILLVQMKLKWRGAIFFTVQNVKCTNSLLERLLKNIKTNLDSIEAADHFPSDFKTHLIRILKSKIIIISTSSFSYFGSPYQKWLFKLKRRFPARHSNETETGFLFILNWSLLRIKSINSAIPVAVWNGSILLVQTPDLPANKEHICFKINVYFASNEHHVSY